MKAFLGTKVLRLLLSLSVSIWMAGGCLFGCSNTALGAEVSQPEHAVAAGASCHAKQAHNCCPKAHSKKVKAAEFRHRAEVAYFVPVPRGTMTDCPLMVNATAVTSKKSTHLPEQAQARIAHDFQFAKDTDNVAVFRPVDFLPNRGPTHLRCCVFLI